MAHMDAKRILDPAGWPLRRGSVVVAAVAGNAGVEPRQFVLTESLRATVEALHTTTYEIMELPLEEKVASVLLLTNETDLWTDDDRLYRRGQHSTLAYDVLVHTGLPTSLLAVDVWRVVGWLDLSVMKDQPRGLPIRSQDDVRWQFEVKECEALLPYQSRAGRAFNF